MAERPTGNDAGWHVARREVLAKSGAEIGQQRISRHVDAGGARQARAVCVNGTHSQQQPIHPTHRGDTEDLHVAGKNDAVADALHATLDSPDDCVRDEQSW